MSFLTPLGWALTATGILAPAGIPLILADQTKAGEAAGKTIQHTVVNAGKATGQTIVDAELSDAKADEFIKIDQRVKQLQPINSKATKLKDEWLEWYNGLTFWEKTFDDNTFNEARNRWIDLVSANSNDPKIIRETLRFVPSLEQTFGLPDPRNSEGYYATNATFVPTSFKVGAGISAASILGLLLWLKLR